jgi:hypothetical protein
MALQIGGPIGSFPDRVQQRDVPVVVFGTVDYTAAGPPNPQMEPWIQAQLMNAIKNVVGQKMMTGQLTFRHLGTGDFATVLPEIIQASGLEQQGIRIGNLALQFGIDGHRPQPPQQQQQQQQDHIVEARIHVGGLNINASSDRGLDTQGLQNQLKDKAKSQVIWWGIGCGILFVVALGIVGLGFYIWHSARVAMDPSAPSSRSAKASTWDGKSPFTCAGSDAVTISGVKANLSSTAITTTGSCALTLVDCDITAPTAIDAAGASSVTVTGGSLNGSTFAVKAGAAAKVTLAGTKVTGKTQAQGAAKITGP